jgi:hypothetical protein
MQTWNCDRNGGENLCHKSSQQTKSTTWLYNNERRINETSFVPTTSIVCGVKTENSRLQCIETYEKYVTSYWSLCAGNVIADNGDPDGRSVQTGLADRIG